jgi:hypothetical protein
MLLASDYLYEVIILVHIHYSIEDDGTGDLRGMICEDITRACGCAGVGEAT